MRLRPYTCDVCGMSDGEEHLHTCQYAVCARCLHWYPRCGIGEISKVGEYREDDDALKLSPPCPSRLYYIYQTFPLAQMGADEALRIFDKLKAWGLLHPPVGSKSS